MGGHSSEHTIGRDTQGTGFGRGPALQGQTVEALAREWMYFVSKRCQQIEQKTEYGTVKTPSPLPKSRFRKERPACEGAGEGVDGELRGQLYCLSVTVVNGGTVYVETDGIS